MRIRIDFPQPFLFKTIIPVRISDINYGGHVGNDSILSIVHEARIAFLKQWNYTEMNIEGIGLIMADSAIQYKGEAFHGDEICIEICASDITSKSFDLYYKLTTVRNEQQFNIAFVKTGMLCFDYASRKIVAIPNQFLDRLNTAN